ncbi:hypothetical protein MPTK2_8g16020 [Marchantia polymorpha subsp. ruderalis]
MDFLVRVYTYLVLLLGVIPSYTADAKVLNLMWSKAGDPDSLALTKSHRVEVGDVIAFYYGTGAPYHMHMKQGGSADETSTWPSPTQKGSIHKLWQFRDGQSFAVCDFSHATLFDDSGKGQYMWRAPSKGTFYFGFSAEDNHSEAHCSSRVKQIRITVIPKEVIQSAEDDALAPAPAPTAGGPVPIVPVRGPALTPSPTPAAGPAAPSPSSPPTSTPAPVPAPTLPVTPAPAAAATPISDPAPALEPAVPSPGPAPGVEVPVPAPKSLIAHPPPPPAHHHPPPPPPHSHKHNHSAPAPAPSSYSGPPAPPLETPEPIIYSPDVSPAGEPTPPNDGVVVEALPWGAMVIAAAAAVFAA